MLMRAPGASVATLTTVVFAVLGSNAYARETVRNGNSTAAATVTIVHTFTGGVAGSSDALLPYQVILASDGNLYGSAAGAGSPGFAQFGSEFIYGDGGIFKLALSGAETLLSLTGTVTVV